MHGVEVSCSRGRKLLRSVLPWIALLAGLTTGFSVFGVFNIWTDIWFHFGYLDFGFRSGFWIAWAGIPALFLTLEIFVMIDSVRSANGKVSFWLGFCGTMFTIAWTIMMWFLWSLMWGIDSH